MGSACTHSAAGKEDGQFDAYILARTRTLNNTAHCDAPEPDTYAGYRAHKRPTSDAASVAASDVSPTSPSRRVGIYFRPVPSYSDSSQEQHSEGHTSAPRTPETPPGERGARHDRSQAYPLPIDVDEWVRDTKVVPNPNATRAAPSAESITLYSDEAHASPRPPVSRDEVMGASQYDMSEARPTSTMAHHASFYNEVPDAVSTLTEQEQRMFTMYDMEAAATEKTATAKKQPLPGKSTSYATVSYASSTLTDENQNRFSMYDMNAAEAGVEKMAPLKKQLPAQKLISYSPVPRAPSAHTEDSTSQVSLYNLRAMQTQTTANPAPSKKPSLVPNPSFCSTVPNAALMLAEQDHNHFTLYNLDAMQDVSVEALAQANQPPLAPVTDEYPMPTQSSTAIPAPPARYAVPSDAVSFGESMTMYDIAKKWASAPVGRQSGAPTPATAADAPRRALSVDAVPETKATEYRLDDYVDMVRAPELHTARARSLSASAPVYTSAPAKTPVKVPPVPPANLAQYKAFCTTAFPAVVKPPPPPPAPANASIGDGYSSTLHASSGNMGSTTSMFATPSIEAPPSPAKKQPVPIVTRSRPSYDEVKKPSGAEPRPQYTTLAAFHTTTTSTAASTSPSNGAAATLPVLSPKAGQTGSPMAKVDGPLRSTPLQIKRSTARAARIERSEEKMANMRKEAEL